MTFPAFLDTCTVFGSKLNDLLLHLADRGAFRPLWSPDVLDELERNLIEFGLTAERAQKRIATMTEYFPDALVEGYEDLIPGMACEAKDRHVLAAAVRANAEVLVTFNLDDFPAASVQPFEIEVVHPDDFLLDQLDLFPGVVTSVIEHLAATYQHPPVAVDELLRAFTRAGVPRFANEVELHI